MPTRFIDTIFNAQLKLPTHSFARRSHVYLGYVRFAVEKKLVTFNRCRFPKQMVMFEKNGKHSRVKNTRSRYSSHSDWTLLYDINDCQNLFYRFISPLINLFSKTSVGLFYHRQIVFLRLVVPHCECEKYTVKKKIQCYPPYIKRNLIRNEGRTTTIFIVTFNSGRILLCTI